MSLGNCALGNSCYGFSGTQRLTLHLPVCLPTRRRPFRSQGSIKDCSIKNCRQHKFAGKIVHSVTAACNIMLNHIAQLHQLMEACSISSLHTRSGHPEQLLGRPSWARHSQLRPLNRQSASYGSGPAAKATLTCICRRHVCLTLARRDNKSPPHRRQAIAWRGRGLTPAACAHCSHHIADAEDTGRRTHTATQNTDSHNQHSPMRVHLSHTLSDAVAADNQPTLHHPPTKQHCSWQAMTFTLLLLLLLLLPCPLEQAAACRFSAVLLRHRLSCWPPPPP